MEGEDSRGSSSSRRNTPNALWPLPDFTDNDLITMSWQNLIRTIELRGLTPEETELINRRRQFLRNRIHAERRRSQTMRILNDIDYKSSDEQVHIQTQPPKESVSFDDQLEDEHNPTESQNK